MTPAGPSKTFPGGTLRAIVLWLWWTLRKRADQPSSAFFIVRELVFVSFSLLFFFSDFSIFPCISGVFLVFRGIFRVICGEVEGVLLVFRGIAGAFVWSPRRPWETFLNVFFFFLEAPSDPETAKPFLLSSKDNRDSQNDFFFRSWRLPERHLFPPPPPPPPPLLPLPETSSTAIFVFL